MGKYIKYFKTAAELAEYWNFADRTPGPDDSDSTMVAYVNENNAIYYNNSDMSEFEAWFSAQSPEIDATADTVSFSVKTGLFYLDVYQNGELVGEYRPGVDSTESYYVDENLTPLTVTENFVGMWYRDNDGEKGDYITEFSQPVTHNPDPNADPIKLTCYLNVTSDGQTPTRLGNRSLTAATRVYYEDETLGTDVDILNDIYIQNKRAFYQFSAQGEYEVCFEFESENQFVGDYFIYSDGLSLTIETNYPELAEQTNFQFSGPLMNSTIEELTLGAGVQSVNAYMGAYNLSYIYLDDPDKLPAISNTLTGVANEGAIFCDENAVNFSMWQAAKPAGWYINSTGLGAWFGTSSTFPSSGGTDHIYFSFGLDINDHFEVTLDSGNAHFNNQSGPTTVTGDTSSLSTGVTFYTEVNTGETYQGMISVISYDADGNERDRISLPFTVEGEVVPTGDSVTAVCQFVYNKGGNPYQSVTLYDGGDWNTAYIDDDPTQVLPMNTSQIDWTDYGTGTHTITYVRTGNDLYLQGYWLGNSDMVSCQISGTTNWGFHSNDQSGRTSQVMYNDPYLESVTFDANFERIGSENFYSDYALNEIIFEGTSAPDFEGDPTIQFTTLSGTTGTVYIAAGADQSDFSQIMTNLGVGWTLVQLQ